MTLPKLLTVKDVADYLGAGNSTVYRLIDSGRLRAVKVGMSTSKPGVRITETALLEFLGEPVADVAAPPNA